MAGNNDKLFDRDITRKEFVLYVSMAVFSLFGVKNFLNIFNGKAHHTTTSDADKGFGARKFGD